MRAGYFVQAYKAKGERLLGQPTQGYAYHDEAIAAAGQLAPWRAGVVAFRQEVDGDGVQRGLPKVLALHGQVPKGWMTQEQVAA